MEKMNIKERINLIKQNEIKPATEYLLTRGFEDESMLPKKAYYYDSYHKSIIFIDECEQLINYRQIGEAKQGYSQKGLVKGSKLTDAIYTATFRKKEDLVFLTESPIDALALYSLGYSAISLFSTSNKPRKWDAIRKFLNFRTVILAFDNDDAGEKFTNEINKKLQFANSICKEVKQLALPEGINDINEFLQKGGLKEYLDDQENFLQLTTSKLSNQLMSCQFVYTKVINGVVKNYVDYNKWINLLGKLGVKKSKIIDEAAYVHEKDGILRVVTKEDIVDVFKAFINHLPTYPFNDVSIFELRNIFIKGAPTYFNDSRLQFLETTIHELDKDNDQEAYIIFSNGYLSIQKQQIGFFSHDYLKRPVWQNQLINHEFAMLENTDDKSMGMFKVFVYNITGKDPVRFKSMLSIIGYLLHISFKGKRRAVIITDSAMTQSPEGRSGKSLLAKGLNKIRKMKILNGKSYDTQNRFRYQEVDYDAHIVVIDDARRNLNFEVFFNDVTEGISVEKKNKQPFMIDAKIIITSNQTINLDGGSAKDRAIEIQLSDHYNIDYCPLDEFGMSFFDDWDQEEWNKFYYFMAQCLQVYMKEGVLEYPNFNLDERKILDQVPEELAEYLEKQIIVDSKEEIVEFDKKDLHQKFLQEYESFRNQSSMNKQQVFTRFVSKWCTLHPDITNFQPRKSNGRNYISFTVNRSEKSDEQKV